VSGNRRGNGRAALVTAATAVSLVVLGTVTGFIGVMQATALIKFGAVHLSFGAVIVGVANFLFGLLAVWGLDSRDASALPGLGWFIAVAIALYGPRPGGDILLPGSGWDVISFAIAGPVGAVLAGLFGRRVMSRRTASPEAPPDR
jgi:hypothetical protein